MIEKRLNALRESHVEMEFLKGQIADMEFGVLNPRTAQYSHAPGRGTGGGGDLIGENIARIDALKLKYHERLNWYLDEYEELMAKLDVLDHREQMVMKFYYFQGLSGNEMARRIGITYQRSWKIKKIALEKLRASH